MERINKILFDKEYVKLTEEIVILEQGRPFCVHTLQHFIDVGRIAWILWLEENCGAARDFSVYEKQQHINIKECFYAVGLLHDLGRAQQYLTGEKHPQVSARMALPLLINAGFNKAEQDLVISAIKVHNQPMAEKVQSGSWKQDGVKKLEFIDIVQRADILSRPCYNCQQQSECYKLERMHTREGLIY